MTQHEQTCPIAAFLNVFGDAWTLLVLREAFYGASRFKDYQRNTGIAKNLLSDRLKLLLEHGVLERTDIGNAGTRYAYTLSSKGRSLGPVLMTIMQWSNEHLYTRDERPVQLVERDSRRSLAPPLPRSASGEAIDWQDVVAIPGPGASPAARARILSATETSP